MRLKRGFSSGRAEAGMRLEHAERKLRGASTKAHPDQPAEAQRPRKRSRSPNGVRLGMRR